MDIMKLEDNQTINSLQLVDSINQLRLEEGKKELRHDNLLRKIKQFALVAPLNFEESAFIDESGKSNLMYEMDLTGARILAASESKVILVKLIQRLDQIEKDYKQAQQLLLEAAEKERQALALISWEYRWGKKKAYGK